MKKMIIIAILFLNFNFCFSQNTDYKLYDSELSIIESNKLFVTKYVDSLNSFSYKKGMKLPTFFYDYNFDRKRFGWRGLHTSVSFRKLIIDRINNVKLLEAVLKSRDRRLKKKHKIPRKYYMGDVRIPFQEYSTYTLVKYRLQELWNEDSMGKDATNYPK